MIYSDTISTSNCWSGTILTSIAPPGTIEEAFRHLEYNRVSSFVSGLTILASAIWAIHITVQPIKPRSSTASTTYVHTVPYHRTVSHTGAV